MKYNTKIVLAFFCDCSVPVPEQELVFHATRKWRFDFAWPQFWVALEVEGGVWTRGAHGRGSGITRDIEKYNEAAALGWRVLRVTPENLCLMQTINLLKRALGITVPPDRERTHES